MRTLVTTAIQDTWKNDDPTYFLGDWCKIYSQKKIWSQMNSITQEYHWDDRSKLFSDYKYLIDFYEKALKDLTNRLNHIHGIKKSERYWRIFVGPWLSTFVMIAFDRWLAIQIAINKNELSKTIGLAGDSQILIPNDLNVFNEIIGSDEWNHFFYLDILKKSNKIKIEFINIKDKKVNFSKKFKNFNLKLNLYKIISFCASYLFSNNNIVTASTSLPRLNEILLQLRLRQFPQIWLGIKPVCAPIDSDQRNWKMFLEGNNDFERFVLDVIPKQIPRVYLEGYQKLTYQCQNLKLPKRPKVIFSSNLLWFDTTFIIYTAEKVEQGASLVYCQHGGGYGTSKFHFPEEHEVRISNLYLTWGWEYPCKKNITPVGIVKVRGNKIKAIRETLLFVTLNQFRYSYRLDSEAMNNYEKYINRSFSFIEQLDSEIFSKTLIRNPSLEIGLNLPQRWHDKFPTIKVDNGHANIYSLIRNARIVVHTYNQTGFLETLAIGIPALLIVDLNITPIRESATRFYELLKQIKVLHDNPYSAASHINLIWDDIDSWWKSDEVQEGLALFINNYCRVDNNIEKNIKAILQKSIIEA
jgi:putative transferase (TIGR04331 family)